MQTILEKQLSKGPRAYYRVSLVSTDGPGGAMTFSVVHSWSNPKSTSSRSFPVADEAAGRSLLDTKVSELLGRGYHPVKRPSPADDAPAAQAESPQVAASETSLAVALERRRRQATWAIG